MIDLKPFHTTPGIYQVIEDNDMFGAIEIATKDDNYTKIYFKDDDQQRFQFNFLLLRQQKDSKPWIKGLQCKVIMKDDEVVNIIPKGIKSW